MALDPARLRTYAFEPRVHAYTQRDAILYALGLGLGRDPVDVEELAFLDERHLSVAPTFAVTLGSPGSWVQDPALGVDWRRLVHAEQAAVFHAPLPPSGEVRAHARIAGLHDRGAGRGAVVVVVREIADARTDQPYCTLHQTLLLRGDGGFGGEPAPAPGPWSTPDRPADVAVSLEVSPRAALIYRLSGDWNPLHLDPEIAQAAGFAKPILQGLASYGMVGCAIVRACGGGDPGRLRSLDMRFSGVVTPGDRLDLKLWREGGCVLGEGRIDGSLVITRIKASLDPP